MKNAMRCLERSMVAQIVFVAIFTFIPFVLPFVCSGQEPPQQLSNTTTQMAASPTSFESSNQAAIEHQSAVEAQDNVNNGASDAGTSSNVNVNSVPSITMTTTSTITTPGIQITHQYGTVVIDYDGNVLSNTVAPPMDNEYNIVVRDSADQEILTGELDSEMDTIVLFLNTATHQVTGCTLIYAGTSTFSGTSMTYSTTNTDVMNDSDD